MPEHENQRELHQRITGLLNSETFGLSEPSRQGHNFSLMNLILIVCKGRIDMVLKNTTTRSIIQAQYHKLSLTDEDFTKVTELLPKAVIKTKILKIAQLKRLILGFSELRAVLVA